jgi:sporulation protein YlmC with PRC-barrel domain
MRQLVACAVVAALGLAAQVATAQVAGKSTLGITVIEQQKLLMGYSAKKDLLGKNVMNDEGKSVGKVEDLIVAPDRSVTAAIVSTGGFVGMGKHDVAIPTDQFKMDDNGGITLPGATKESLKALPEFEYTKHHRSSGS